MKKILTLSIFFILFFNVSLQAQPDAAGLQRWKDLKFSMFIHWGIYSELGGVWEGKPISKGLSEQIQAHAGIYSDTYAAVAKRFNPSKWNADSIALLAKAAGMRSVVITSKHHDGFCMFQSAYTDFDVVDATPFKRDVVKELSEACQRHGLRFGVYFSLIDWHFPQASPISSHNSDFITPEHHAYNKKQVTELLTHYGPISELWFDMGSQFPEQSKELRDLVHNLQPACMVSSRIGNDMGDFTVMGDNQEPDYSIGVPWQSPASFFDETWGYRSWQKRESEEEKVREKLTSLIRVASRGGNYLLNIGPRGDGSVVDFEKHVLLKIGKWLQKNGTAIYETQPDPFRVAFDWGSITSRPNALYLHLLVPPKNGVITLPGLKGDVKASYIVDGKRVLHATKSANGITLNLPKDLSVINEFKVIAVEFKNGYTITPVHVIPEKDKHVTVNTENAFKYYSNSGIDYNTRYVSTVKESWITEVPQAGTFTPSLYYSAQEKGRTIDLIIDGKEQAVRLDDGEAVTLQNDPASLSWGNPYIAGPFWSGLEGLHGDIHNLDPTHPWQDQPWRMQPDWQSGKQYWLPADMLTGYYVLQEINSPKDQPLLINVTGGEGTAVYVNGEIQLIHLAPRKEAETVSQYTVLISLKKGKNQLLVKLFGNFHKKMTYAVQPSGQQVMYRKKLAALSLKKGFHDISWKLHDPETPHQTLLLPNLSLELTR